MTGSLPSPFPISRTENVYMKGLELFWATGLFLYPASSNVIEHFHRTTRQNPPLSQTHNTLFLFLSLISLALYTTKEPQFQFYLESLAFRYQGSIDMLPLCDHEQP